MQEKDILKDVVDALIEKPLFEVTVPIKEPKAVKYSFWDRLLGRPKPTPELERTFVIKPCLVGNMKRIAGRSALLPKEIFQGSLSEVVLPLINQHLDDVIYIVAAGIQNTKREPDPELIEFIHDNFEAEDLYNTLLPVLENSGLQSFLNTIALAKGTIKILQPNASPLDGSELIASHIQE